MRSVCRLPFAVLSVLFAGLVVSCSEDTVTADRDLVSPETRVIFPISDPDNRTDISDSVDVYVVASDDRLLARVEIWSALETEAQPTRIAQLTTPLQPSEIPDSLRPGDGSPVFRARWHTRLIRNGTIVRIFSRAYDASGNSARSTLVVVRILNIGGDLFPPNADFTITPPTGTVETVFVFDAGSTTDDIDAPEDIVVRWDFDGDGVWDIDFGEETPATAHIEHRFNRARIYTVVMEAKNTYLPGRVGRAQRSLEVTNVGGTPRPPEPQEMLRIPAGTYRVGTSETNRGFGDEDEFPLHQARLTTDYFIRRTEEPNRLYLRFLRESMGGDAPRVRRDNTVIRFYPNRVEPEEPDSTPVVLLNLDKSEIFYDPDGDSMAVRPEASNLPVVGVTYSGAKIYAEHFGMRLPTEHEWEIAAKADSVNFLYPWGRTISPEQANYNYQGNPYNGPRPIGAYPSARSPFGLLDMSGNVKEWAKDFYGPYQAGLQSNPEGPISGTLRVIRGGSYLTTASGVRVSNREAALPTTTSDQIGFRTAYTAP